ncbi:hypothetical protein BVG96_03120 [Serratia marcescens]|uniref:Uncharacterized protein n=1 Tax=Serratia marcescens SM39 TaxID=1334564 RepID=A0AAT9EG42_SERMA|nr:hypothetical protein BVG96_03120 [Serratia marcescens]BAO32796.1 hypothetical protein SM39_0739 [Serratia marcescens SM39]
MGHAPSGPLQAAFKSAPGRFVTPVTYLSKLLGTDEPRPEAPPSGQRKRCSNRFPTDLSRSCRREATPII